MFIIKVYTYEGSKIVLRFDGFYISKEKQAIIEAPTPSGEYIFQSYNMFRFYNPRIWISANSLDTNALEFWDVTQKIMLKQLTEGLKTGNIWFENQGKNHSFNVGEYEIEKNIIYTSFEYKLFDNETMFSEMLSWSIKEKCLSGSEETSDLLFTPCLK